MKKSVVDALGYLGAAYIAKHTGAGACLCRKFNSGYSLEVVGVRAPGGRAICDSIGVWQNAELRVEFIRPAEKIWFDANGNVMEGYAELNTLEDLRIVLDRLVLKYGKDD